MSYESAIKAAGAEVLVSRQFGDYQGEAWAKVSYQGAVGWVSWAFGSCSGCDAYESWSMDLKMDHWDDEDDHIIIKERLAEFGLRYLDHIMSQEQAEAAASRNIEWDDDAEEVLAFIRENSIKEV